jgi:hypothetical protein
MNLLFQDSNSGVMLLNKKLFLSFRILQASTMKISMNMGLAHCGLACLVIWSLLPYCCQEMFNVVQHARLKGQ